MKLGRRNFQAGGEYHSGDFVVRGKWVNARVQNSQSALATFLLASLLD
jgi:hypothetical protein